APVRITALTESSPAARWNASPNALLVGPSMALALSGRLRRTTTTWPSCSYSTVIGSSCWTRWTILPVSAAAREGTMPLRATDLFHTGVVVEDLDSSIDRLSAVAGYRWTKPLAATTPIRTPAGDTEVPFRIVYSLDAPYVELIQAVPGTLWTPAPG